MRVAARTTRHRGAQSRGCGRFWRPCAALLFGIGVAIGPGLGARLPIALTAPAAAAEQSVARATQQLFEAVHGNDLAAARASVAAGADLEAKDRWGLTAIELAIDKGYYEIAHFLAAARSARRSGRQRTPGLPEAARSALSTRNS